MKNKIDKIIIFLIIIALILAGIIFYEIMKKDERISQMKEKIENIVNNEMVAYNENETNTIVADITNELDTTINEEEDEVPGDMGEYYISIGKWKKFEFNTPVGENGKFEIYAEKAFQGSGFSGASSHIYYLREGELYYHNQENNDIKLATGIIDLKKQGEDIIAVKGEGYTIYVENQYIQYE